MSAAAASVIGLAAAPAFAASTWTVKPGGAVTGTAGKTTVTDATKKLSVTCTSSTIKASLRSGKGLPGAGLGTVSSMAFNNCAGGALSVTITGTMPLNGVSFSAGVSSMTITKIHGTITVSAVPGCSATIDGTGATAKNGMVKAKFSNTANTLTVSAAGGNLHIYNPSSACGTTISNKDAVNFAGAYKFNTKQTITSP